MMAETKPGAEGGKGYQKLQKLKTMGEILGTAKSFEETAYQFYSSLAPQVDKPLRELVQELADEELQHVHLFAELAVHPEVERRIVDKIQAPDNDHRFSDYVHLPSLDEFPDDQSILQYAMGREHAAMEQYASLAEATPAGPIRDLFRFLANEELAHKAELEKRYYELIYL